MRHSHVPRRAAGRRSGRPLSRRARLLVEPLEGRVHLNACDFNGDGWDDLAVGIPTRDVGGAVDAGAVRVLYGSETGLTSTGSVLLHQNSPGILDQAEAGDHFGANLAV